MSSHNVLVLLLVVVVHLYIYIIFKNLCLCVHANADRVHNACCCAAAFYNDQVLRLVSCRLAYALAFLGLRTGKGQLVPGPYQKGRARSQDLTKKAAVDAGAYRREAAAVTLDKACGAPAHAAHARTALAERFATLRPVRWPLCRRRPL